MVSQLAFTECRQFRGGDDFVEPFLIENTDGSIADLTGATVTGTLSSSRGQVGLTVGNGIEIANLNPPVASGTDPQLQHLYVHLTPAQTEGLPYGALSSLWLTIVSADRLTTSTQTKRLERIR